METYSVMESRRSPSQCRMCIHNYDPFSSSCRQLVCTEHKNAYRFVETTSRCIIISRDARFMEDEFASGRRCYGEDKKFVAIPDDEITYRESASSLQIKGDDEDTTKDQNCASEAKCYTQNPSLEQSSSNSSIEEIY